MVWATRAVSSGMAGIGCGCNDMGLLLIALTLSLLSVSHMLTFASLCERQGDSEQRAVAKLSHLQAIQPSGRQVLFV